MGQGTISPNTATSSETAIAVFGNWARLAETSTINDEI